MQTDHNKRIFLWGILYAIELISLVLCMALLQGFRTQMILGTLVCLSLTTVIHFALELHRSMRETLYRYKNIALTGGILFLGLLFLVLLSFFAESLADGQLTLSVVIGKIVAFPREFSYYAVFVLTVIFILLAISNAALIRHEGFRPKNALSLLWAGFYIGGTFLIYFLSDVCMERIFSVLGWTKNRVFLALHTAVPLFLLLLLCYLECVFVGSAVIGWIAARKKPDLDRDYIIILGCSIDRRGGLLPLLKGRVNRAIRFAWEQEIATGKPLYYVPSGGQGTDEIMSEGSAMELYLKTRGAEDNEVFPEKRSTNTSENFRFSKQIIDALKPDAKIAFATTNYHILRAGILAGKLGMDAQGIAGDTKWYFWPNGFLREFFAILSLERKWHIVAAVLSALLCLALGGLVFFGVL